MVSGSRGVVSVRCSGGLICRIYISHGSGSPCARLSPFGGAGKGAQGTATPSEMDATRIPCRRGKRWSAALSALADALFPYHDDRSRLKGSGVGACWTGWHRRSCALVGWVGLCCLRHVFAHWLECFSCVVTSARRVSPAAALGFGRLSNAELLSLARTLNCLESCMVTVLGLK